MRDGGVWVAVRVVGLESELLDDCVVEWLVREGNDNLDSRVRRMAWRLAKAVKRAREEAEDGRRGIRAK